MNRIKLHKILSAGSLISSCNKHLLNVLFLLFSIIIINTSYAQNINYPYSYDTESGVDTTGQNVYYKGKSLRSLNFTLKINEFLAINGSVNQDNYGEYEDWIEIYNYGIDDIDLLGVFITDDIANPTKWEITSSIIVPADGYVILWADEEVSEGINHLNFKLDDQGEEIAIFTPDSVVLIDYESYNEQVYNISKGRQPNGGVNWNFFDNPTPGAPNDTIGLLEITPNPNFSLHGGFYTNSFTLTLDVDTNSSLIYYTTNGSVPNQSSTQYTIPLLIDSTTIVRAIAYKHNCVPSRVVTHTYFMNINSNIPVLSLTTSNTNIWGNNVDVPVHVEYYEEDGTLGFSVDGATQLHGKASQPQKGFRLHMRAMYGDNEIKYKIFDNKPVDTFKRIVFRNAGNDGLFYGARSHMRDAVIQTAVIKSNSTTGTSGYQPVNVFINGKYHALYNLRERIDRYYVENTYGYDEDLPMDILERCFGANNPYTNHDIIEGDWNDYDTVRNFADTADISIAANYDFLKSRVDIENFADYWITEVYFGNYDWLSNNIKLWKPDTLGAKFGWVFWDLDHGLGLPYNTPTGNASDPNWNTLDWGTSTIPGDRPWGGANTRLIRGLLENEEFKKYFVIRFADLMNSYFSPDSVTAIIDSLENYLLPEIPRYIAKWGSSLANWQGAVQTIRNYSLARTDFVRQHLKLQYSLDDTINLDINCMPAGAGIINLNTITLSHFPWKGKYYSGMPNTIEAIAKPGYEFYGWIGSSADTNIITINPTSDTSLTAVFLPSIPTIDTNIVINEINYNSSPFFNTDDWVELYNNSPNVIIMEDWTFVDESNNSFEFPDDFVLDPYSYVILAADLNTFSLFYPTITNTLGDLGFGLSGAGEMIKLFNDHGVCIDSVQYDDQAPWPTEPDGNGPTLVLKGPDLDNYFAINWEPSSLIHGSPGTADSLFSQLVTKISSEARIDIYPNPTNTYVNFIVNLEKSQHIKISIYDIHTRKVVEVVDDNFPQGNNIIPYHFENYLMSGVYFYNLETENTSITKKLIISN